MIKCWLLTCCAVVTLMGCSKSGQAEKVRIAINPWPGYEFLYLAGQKGFFAERGLNVEIVELSSLADVQRIYIQGRVEGFGSTVIEAVQAAGATQLPLNVILVPDFSNGGDVILGSGTINKVSDLRGKKVGVEVGSLGMFFLYSALKANRMTLDDVQVVNVEQLDALTHIKSNQVDAMVTYPPFSLELLKQDKVKQIFDSSEIPGKIIDTISLRTTAVKDMAQWIEKFHQVWQRTLDYAAENRQEAYGIMAQREGIAVNEFAEALSGLEIIEASKQAKLLNSKMLKDNVKEVCDVLTIAKSITFECDNIDQLVKGYK